MQWEIPVNVSTSALFGDLLPQYFFFLSSWLCRWTNVTSLFFDMTEDFWIGTNFALRIIIITIFLAHPWELCCIVIAILFIDFHFLHLMFVLDGAFFILQYLRATLSRELCLRILSVTNFSFYTGAQSWIFLFLYFLFSSNAFMSMMSLHTTAQPINRSASRAFLLLFFGPLFKFWCFQMSYFDRGGGERERERDRIYFTTWNK